VDAHRTTALRVPRIEKFPRCVGLRSVAVQRSPHAPITEKRRTNFPRRSEARAHYQCWAGYIIAMSEFEYPTMTGYDRIAGALANLGLGFLIKPSAMFCVATAYRQRRSASARPREQRRRYDCGLGRCARRLWYPREGHVHAYVSRSGLPRPRVPNAEIVDPPTCSRRGIYAPSPLSRFLSLVRR
jgi:hypothetical protein